MGTMWITRVLESVGNRFDLKVQKSNLIETVLNADADVLICNHSQHAPDSFGDFVGSHLIRDPRDAIVSGYFYHLWTDESWAREPQRRFAGLSYQQHLATLDQGAGIGAEIDRFAEYVHDYGLLTWDYHDPRMLELKYEDLIRNEGVVFKELFQHYGFTARAVGISMQLALQQSFKNVSQRQIGEKIARSHLRSGEPGEWKSVLTREHRRQIHDRLGELIERMGYESSL